MILRNPTKNDLTIVYKGQEFSINAESVSENIPAEVAYHWINKIHSFLEVVNDEAEADSDASGNQEAETKKPETKSQKKAREAAEKKAQEELNNAAANNEPESDEDDSDDSEDSNSPEEDNAN
jgi:hypothetical protein